MLHVYMNFVWDIINVTTKRKLESVAVCMIKSRYGYPIMVTPSEVSHHRISRPNVYPISDWIGCQRPCVVMISG